MRRITLFILLISCSLFRAESQYISEVLEYVPAPGQFINTPAGFPSATSSICGGINGSLSLGAFGGYVVFRFGEAVEDHPENPYGVDFTIFGNALTEWSEPGIVWVMKDSNGNGLPDDSWFQLAGSDYYFSSTLHRYRVTYTNPGGTAAKDVPWKDHMGDSGTVKVNDIHTQPYYPLADSFSAIGPDSYALEGTRIDAVIDTSNLPQLLSVKRSFGYADNRLRGDPLTRRPDNPYTPGIEYSGGDAFDIGWAVDSTGNYIDLDSIHFVRVQSGVMAHGRWLGEISTEIAGALDVAPDHSLTGITDMIVIRDLPGPITVPEYPLEVFVFEMGRLRTGASIRWETDLEGASVDQDNLLHLTRSGTLTLTATLEANPEVRATATTIVQLDPTLTDRPAAVSGQAGIYPNPAGDILHLSGFREWLQGDGPSETLNLTIRDASGRHWLTVVDHDPAGSVDISGLYPGLYYIHVRTGQGIQIFKFIKR